MSIIGDGIELMKLINIGANAELYGKMAKFVEEAQELKLKVEQLEEANKILREQLRFKSSLSRIGGNVFADGDDEPLCARCAEVDNRPVHILKRPMRNPICPHCKTEYSFAPHRSTLGSTDKPPANT